MRRDSNRISGFAAFLYAALVGCGAETVVDRSASDMGEDEIACPLARTPCNANSPSSQDSEPGSGAVDDSSGNGPDPEDGGGEVLFPQDMPDDLLPYDLPANCEALPTWPVTGYSPYGRVAALGPAEAFVITYYNPDTGGKLLHFLPDGTIEETGWEQLYDVWTCGDDVWASGNNGVVLHRPAGGEWYPIDLDIETPLRSGFGCSEELWIPAYDHVLVLSAGTVTRSIPVIADFPIYEIERMHGAGQQRIATRYYGATFRYDAAVDAFVYASGTDDIITDVFVRRDGSGFSLHGGYGLEIVKNSHLLVEGLTAMRVSRRSDEDAWFVGFDRLTHLGPEGFTVIDAPGYNEDVDARGDAVWAVGSQGAAILTQAGLCPVTPEAP